jgi:hypothetical protein
MHVVTLVRLRTYNWYALGIQIDSWRQLSNDTPCKFQFPDHIAHHRFPVPGRIPDTGYRIPGIADKIYHEIHLLTKKRGVLDTVGVSHAFEQLFTALVR